MKLDASDFPRLQFSLLAATLMIAIGAGAVHALLKVTKTAHLGRVAAQSERDDFDGKLKRVRNEENEIKAKSAVFKKLQERGVIGEERRLEWVELIKEIRDKRRLIDLEYEISPQRPLDKASGSSFSFFTSTMKMQLKLLHEEDLTRLLGDLQQRANALIQVKSCDISRLVRGGAESGSPAQLQADCQIDWITLREATSK